MNCEESKTMSVRSEHRAPDSAAFNMAAPRSTRTSSRLSTAQAVTGPRRPHTGTRDDTIPRHGTSRTKSRTTRARGLLIFLLSTELPSSSAHRSATLGDSISHHSSDEQPIADLSHLQRWPATAATAAAAAAAPPVASRSDRPPGADQATTRIICCAYTRRRRQHRHAEPTGLLS